MPQNLSAGGIYEAAWPKPKPKLFDFGGSFFKDLQAPRRLLRPPAVDPPMLDEPSGYVFEPYGVGRPPPRKALCRRTVTVQVEYDADLVDDQTVARRVFEHLRVGETVPGRDGALFAWTAVRSHFWNTDVAWAATDG